MSRYPALERAWGMTSEEIRADMYRYVIEGLALDEHVKGHMRDGHQVRAYERDGSSAVQKNIQRGKDAIRKALQNKTSVHRAMFREKLGWIDFEWGSEGKIRPSGKTSGGFGLSHILEARQRKDSMTKEQAIQFLYDAVETIAKGKETRRTEVSDWTRVSLEDSRSKVVLAKRKGGNAFIITGYEKKVAG